MAQIPLMLLMLMAILSKISLLRYRIGATYKFNEKLRSTLAYGALFADDDTGYA